EMLGYAPASPMPNRKRTTSRQTYPLRTNSPRLYENDQMQPVRAVNSDHHRTMRISVRRGPYTSPSQPLGTSNAAYARANAEKSMPFSVSLRPNSRWMWGAMVPKHTRSR